MRFKLLLLSFLAINLAFQSCSSDDEPSAMDDPITEANVRAVFNFLPPAGYESTFYNENLPDNVQAGYSNSTIDQNVAVQASENLSGNVIDVDDTLVEAAFDLPIADITKSTVNGTDVYEAMQSNSYRAVIFRGQYQFDVIVQNDPTLAVGMEESGLFVDLITEAMTTF